MKRENCKSLSIFAGIDCDSRSIYIDPEYAVSDDDLSSVLNEIFSVDPLTGLPRGDIAYFLSKDGNPQVKAWLETNLLSPRTKDTGSSLEGVTDDFIVEYARHEDETVAAYQSRLMSIFDEAKKNYESQIKSD